MKSAVFTLACYVCVTNSIFAQANQIHSVTLHVGAYTPIANQLDHGSSTADILFPNPNGLRNYDLLLVDYNYANGTFTTYSK